MLKVFPVIHHATNQLTLDMAELAHRCGADGVFLISHRGRDADIVELACEVQAMHADFSVGINLLSQSAVFATQVALDRGLNMVWADYMGVSSQGLTAEGQMIARRAAAHPHIDFFASVAFKYQREELAPALAAQHAQEAGFIATTSGSGTGHAPELSKIVAMSEAAGGRLAVASGMTPQNIAQFAPYLSHCLVATGISQDEYHLDEELLRAFLRAAWGDRHRVEV